MVTMTPPGMFPPTLPMNVVEEPVAHKISVALGLRQAVYGAAGTYPEPLSVVVDPGRPDVGVMVRVVVNGLPKTTGVPLSEATGMLPHILTPEVTTTPAAETQKPPK
jgi:hypothetical protein